MPDATAPSVGMKHKRGQRRTARRLGLVLLAAGSTGCSDGAPPAVGNVASRTPVVQSALVCLLTAPQRVPLTEPAVPLGFTLRNDSAWPVTVLGRQTPLEGILGNLFAVTLAGRQLEYRGPMVKRGPPGVDEFVTIASGLDEHATVDLAAGYDLSSPGRYRVRFMRHDAFACNELTIERY